MGVIQDFKIVFDNPEATYYGGQIISGRIQLKLKEPIKIRGIELKFKGEANVHWTERRTVKDSDGKTHTVTDDYRAHETYLEEKRYILGGEEQQLTLPAGDHVYPFQKQLPQCVPPSFEGEKGHIRYTVETKLDQPWKFDHETRAAFTVMAHLDLNQESNVKEPVKQEMHKYLCCCCCKSGPITMVIMLPLTGYVPDQNIPITVELDNNTDTRIADVCFKLTKVIKFHATGPHNKTVETKDKVTSLSFGSVVPNGSNTWANDMHVPSLLPSFLKYCSIMDIEYHLKGKAVIEGPHFNLESHNIPIVIGTMPIIEYAPPASTIPPSISSDISSDIPPTMGFVDSSWDPPPSFNEAVGDDGDKLGIGWNVIPSAPVDPSALSAPSAPHLPVVMHPDISPPSFEESILDNDMNQHTQRQMGFNPHYPTYQPALKT